VAATSPWGQRGPDGPRVRDHQRRQRAGGDGGQRRGGPVALTGQRLAARERERRVGRDEGGELLGRLAGDLGDRPSLPASSVGLDELGQRRGLQAQRRREDVGRLPCPL
jgi:hypothetical protein